MPVITYDVSGADHEKTESAQPLGPIPKKGVYTCWVAAINSVAKKSKPTESQLEFIFRVAGGENANYPFWDYVDPGLESTQWKWDQLLYALGIDTAKAEKGKFNTDTYVGKNAQQGKKTKVRVSIDHDSFTNNDGVTTVKAKVRGVYRYDPTKDEEYVPTSDLAHPPTNDEGDPFGDENTDWSVLGAAADADDKGAIDALTEKAEELDLDPDTYPTWAELADEIVNMLPEPEEEPPTPAAKATKATKKAAAAPEPEPEPDEDDIDWSEQGELADADDDDAISMLTEKAEELGWDINDYELWMDLATAIMEESSNGDGETPDYESMSDEDLRAELTTRGLKSNGPRNALLLRLKKDDGNPFDTAK